jgi:hypothetical protein
MAQFFSEIASTVRSGVCSNFMRVARKAAGNGLWASIIVRIQIDRHARLPWDDFVVRCVICRAVVCNFVPFARLSPRLQALHIRQDPEQAAFDRLFPAGDHFDGAAGISVGHPAFDQAAAAGAPSRKDCSLKLLGPIEPPGERCRPNGERRLNGALWSKILNPR